MENFEKKLVISKKNVALNVIDYEKFQKKIQKCQVRVMKRSRSKKPQAYNKKQWPREITDTTLRNVAKKIADDDCCSTVHCKKKENTIRM